MYGVALAIEKWRALSGGSCIVVDSKVVFLANGRPRGGLYATKDGLHPNGRGGGGRGDHIQQVLGQTFSTANVVEHINSKYTRKLVSL